MAWAPPAPGRARDWLRGHPVAADLLLAVFAVAVELVLTGLLPSDLRPTPWLMAVGPSVAGAVPVALRRAAPWFAVGTAMVLAVATVFWHRQSLTMVLAYVLLTYSTAARFPLRRAVLAGGLLWLPVLVGNVLVPDAIGADDVSLAYRVLTNAMVALVCFFIGRTVHNRRAYTAALEERTRAAERDRHALADRAVAEERRRIARELHDVVAHHVSVMGVLATAARRVLARDPAAADEALGTIEETGRTSLREMGRLLSVLRTEAEPTVELAPQPDLAGIEALVEQVRDAGLPVNLWVTGEPVTLDPGVALAVYRIVQEALTNTLKHAGTATAEVWLDFGQRWLRVEVVDTGRGERIHASPTASGHGLLGMRERAAIYGGTLRTGPRPGGGFRVIAQIPVERSDR